LTAILSADVVGYSRMMSADDVGTVRRLNEIRSLMKTCVEGYRGRVVDAPGDAMLADFQSVVDAVECSVVIQKELKNQNERLPENRRMHVRIGINLGDVIVEGDKIYGDGVNIAARLESLAEPGGICISGSAYDQIENKLPFGYESLGPQMVKNFSKPVQVYRAITSVDAEAQPAPPPVSEPAVRPAARIPVAQPAAVTSRPAPERAARRVPRRTALVAGALVAIGAIGGVAVWRLTQPAAITAATPTAVLEKPSLAVLPIVNATGDSAREALTAQVDADVRNGLASLSGLATSPLTSVLPYRTRSVSVSQAARELNVRYILDGNMKMIDGRARIVASLIDTATGTTLWMERFDASHVAAAERDLLLRTIGALPITLTADDQSKLAVPKARVPAATSPAAARPASRTAPKAAAPAVKPPMPAPLVEQLKAAPGAGPSQPGSARRENGSRVAPPAPPREQIPTPAPEPAPQRPAPPREIPQQS
jgi:class 3 adenylate cyclase/TolB-like protein